MYAASVARTPSATSAKVDPSIHGGDDTLTGRYNAPVRAPDETLADVPGAEPT